MKTPTFPMAALWFSEAYPCLRLHAHVTAYLQAPNPLSRRSLHVCMILVDEGALTDRWTLL